MTKMFIGALEKWARNNSDKAPQNVLVYRDGVSEGQYDTVLRVELNAMKTGWEQFKRTRKLQHELKFSLIVCGKRHNTRFYPQSSDPKYTNTRTWNPKNGTVVDRYVVIPTPACAGDY